MADDDLRPSDLGIDLPRDADDPTPQALYRWLLASLLFGRPVQQSVSADTFHVLIDHGLTSPATFARKSREELRRILDEGSYARIDYVMSDELHTVMAGIDDEYDSVNHLVRSSSDAAELRRRLTAYKGVGPKTVEIFERWLPTSLYGTA
jgi:3-methyladenine DNA glycosylase/8-oxoguanine DNA glycosylase